MLFCFIAAADAFFRVEIGKKNEKSYLFGCCGSYRAPTTIKGQQARTHTYGMFAMQQKAKLAASFLVELRSTN